MQLVLNYPLYCYETWLDCSLECEYVQYFTQGIFYFREMSIRLSKICYLQLLADFHQSMLMSFLIVT